MITIDNYKTEIERLKEKGLLDKVCVSISKEMDNLMPQYNKDLDITNLIDKAVELLNDNQKLHMKDKGVTDDGGKKENANRARALLLKMRMAAAKLDGIDSRARTSKRVTLSGTPVKRTTRKRTRTRTLGEPTYDMYYIVKNENVSGKAELRR